MSLKIVKTLALDFTRNAPLEYIFVKAGDKNSRVLDITPLNSGLAYALPEGVKVVFAAKKPDKTEILNDAKVNTATGHIEVTLSKQTLAAEGILVCEVALYSASDEFLSSQHFYLKASPFALTNIESGNEYNTLVVALLSVDAKVREAENIIKKITAVGTGGQGGRGIVSIERTNGDGSPGSIDTYTITYTDDIKSTFTIYNGADGEDGRGISSFTHIQSYDTYDLYEIEYTDGTYQEIQIPRGNDGKNGTDGISPTVSVNKSGKVTTISITDKNGTKIAIINDGTDGTNGKSAYAYAQEGGYTGTEVEFAEMLATDYGAEINKLSEKIVNLTTIPYGGSKEWLEANGDKTQLYQIDGYVWGYIESNGWTKSGTQFILASSEGEMTNAGGTEYLLRSGDEGTVYSYHEASGDADVPVYDSLPETANEGDIVAVGGRKYKAYLTTEEVPNYTDITKQDGWTWTENHRTNSSGTLTANDGIHATDYIPGRYGDIIRFKGFQLRTESSFTNLHIVDANKQHGSIGIPNVSNLRAPGVYVEDGDITILYAGRDTNGNEISYAEYIRASGKLVGAATLDDVIITINEEITTKTITVVSWTDIGEYIPPVEAGWSATEETHSIIDSLSATANSGDTAVYSSNGYVYSYIEGADWMAMSKYTQQTIDNAMSDTSTNAVQNKVVKAAIDEVNEKSDANANEIISLKNEVEALGGTTSEAATIPSYWETEVASKTAIVKELQTAGGKDCISFAWASDTHIPDNDNGRTNDIGKVMAKMLDNCEIPFALVTGDINSRASFGEEAGLLEAQAQMPVHLAPLWGTDRLLMSLGNHDGCYGDSSGYYRKQFTPERMWQTFFRGQALDFRRVFSDDGLYYYVDNIPQKIRFIVLNSNFGGEYSVNDNGWAVNNRFSTSCYGQAQFDWLADVALDMPEGYKAIITAHVPPNIGYSVDEQLLIGIVNAYCNKTTYNGSYTAGVDGWSNSTVDVDFTSAKGEIIAIFAGHVHWDKVDTETMVRPIITIIAAGASVNENQMSEGEVAPTRTKGTATETSFDVVTINKATRTIYCTRIGAGVDREVNY